MGEVLGYCNEKEDEGSKIEVKLKPKKEIYASCQTYNNNTMKYNNTNLNCSNSSADANLNKTDNLYYNKNYTFNNSIKKKNSDKENNSQKNDNIIINNNNNKNTFNDISKKPKLTNSSISDKINDYNLKKRENNLSFEQKASQYNSFDKKDDDYNQTKKIDDHCLKTKKEYPRKTDDYCLKTKKDYIRKTDDFCLRASKEYPRRTENSCLNTKKEYGGKTETYYIRKNDYYITKNDDDDDEHSNNEGDEMRNNNDINSYVKRDDYNMTKNDDDNCATQKDDYCNIKNNENSLTKNDEDCNTKDDINYIKQNIDYYAKQYNNYCNTNIYENSYKKNFDFLVKQNNNHCNTNNYENSYKKNFDYSISKSDESSSTNKNNNNNNKNNYYVKNEGDCSASKSDVNSFVNKNNNYFIKKNNNYIPTKSDDNSSTNKNNNYFINKNININYSPTKSDINSIREHNDVYSIRIIDDYTPSNNKKEYNEEEIEENEDEGEEDMEEIDEKDEDVDNEEYEYNNSEENENEENEEEEDEYNEDSESQDYSSCYNMQNNNKNKNSNNKLENKFVFDNTVSFTHIIDDDLNKDPNTDIKDNNLNILMIAEKPSIAKTISNILSKGNKLTKITKKKGWHYYTFNGQFKGKNANFVVSAVSGHLYRTEFLGKYQNFDIDPVVLFDAFWMKKNINEKTIIIEELLKDLSRNKDILCLWLDCDREGENICYEVIYNTLPYMNKRKYQQIYRANFSSLTKLDIIEAFDTMEDYPDRNLSLSVDARQIIDLKVGVSLTRYLTKNILMYLRKKEINSNYLTYGPCQIPTLWFCVNREKEKKKFNQIIYKIYIKLLLKNKTEVEICLDEEFNNINNVKSIIRSINTMNYLEIKNLSREKRTQKPPLGLNTSTMLKLASSQLGYSPQTTMNIAQNLYIKGCITYPRTETTVYSSSFNFKSNLKKFLKTNGKIRKLLKNIKYLELSIQGGNDNDDHPPITPVRNPSKGRLNKKESDLFNLICDYYFASISPNLEYENITYEFLIDNERYKSTCSIIENKGFLDFFDTHDKKFLNKDKILGKKNVYRIKGIRYEENEKENYITEAELIEEMEKNHIGTDSSMNVHITNIVNRGYVKVDKNRRLIPTKLGKALIEALEAVEPDIVLPKNRAIIEGFINDLAYGKKTYEEVLNYSLKFYKEKYINITEKIDEIFDIFGKYFKTDRDY